MKRTLRDSVFLKACRLEKTERTPVWLMRQAGRYMRSYRAIRSNTPFLSLCKNKDLAAEVTVHAQKKIKADAAIIFSDILLILEPMGLKLDYLKGDGPCVGDPVRKPQDVERLRNADPKHSLSFVYAAVKESRRRLASDIPLIGFAGGPFTVASYMIEGGSTRDFSRTRAFMRGTGWKPLMRRIVSATAEHLNLQAAAGAQAVQIFDSWVGYLKREEYEKFVLPYSSKLIRGITDGIPVIHFGTRTGKFIDLVSRAGGDIIGVDHRVNLGRAWKNIGYHKGVQGNLDPALLCKASRARIKSEVKRILKEAGGRPGHIFNLGHGVLPDTPVENVTALVDLVRELSSK